MTDSPDYDAMQRRIRDSQSRIDDTVVALRHRIARLAPRNLMEQTMNRIHRNSGQTSYDSDQSSHSQGHSQGWSASVGDTMRGNPIPLALIGVGIGWLALTSSGYDRRIARSSTLHNVRDRAGDAAQYARDTFYSASGSVRDAASSAYDHASSAVSDAADSVRHMGNRTYSAAGGGSVRGGSVDTHTSGMTDRLWDMVDDHPLVAGVLGVALGAAIGASIPSTRVENRWIGDYADEATSQAKHLAREAMDRGTRAARAAVEAAKDEVGNTVTAASDAAREEVAKPS